MKCKYCGQKIKIRKMPSSEHCRMMSMKRMEALSPERRSEIARAGGLGFVKSLNLSPEQRSLRAKCLRRGIGWKECQKLKKQDLKKLGIAFVDNICVK